MQIVGACMTPKFHSIGFIIDDLYSARVYGRSLRPKTTAGQGGAEPLMSDTLDTDARRIKLLRSQA